MRTICMRTLFELVLEVEDKSIELSYSSIADCLNDLSLRKLFDDEHVKKCLISNCDSVRVAGIPFMSWESFIDRLISNSTSLYRKAYTVKVLRHDRWWHTVGG